MLGKFLAQSLVETKTSDDRRRFELTFIDADGVRQTVSLPKAVAAELAPVLASISECGAGNGIGYTKMPKQWAVGHGAHERVVLLRFDDDPPYALAIEDAEGLCDELRLESEGLARRRQPALQ